MKHWLSTIYWRRYWCACGKDFWEQKDIVSHIKKKGEQND